MNSLQAQISQFYLKGCQRKILLFIKHKMTFSLSSTKSHLFTEVKNKRQSVSFTKMFEVKYFGIALFESRFTEARDFLGIF